MLVLRITVKSDWAIKIAFDWAIIYGTTFKAPVVGHMIDCYLTLFLYYKDSRRQSTKILLCNRIVLN